MTEFNSDNFLQRISVSDVSMFGVVVRVKRHLKVKRMKEIRAFGV